tara:strand:+ start:85 stop:588 length:504 start_codon:yes stop_codon:yes gene_type:complete
MTNLAEAINIMQSTFREDAGAALASFETQSSLSDGMRSDINIRDHELVIDEPEQLGGGDAGPNPVEVVLAALGSCQEITYKVYAAAMGIKLRGVSVSLAGDIDLRGLFGVDDSVRAGFQSIRGEVDIDADASPEKLARLKAAVDAHCPVLDMLQNGVPVQLELKASE